MKRKGDILVVDDDPDLLESVRLVLESEGFEVRTAGGVREARAALDERVPDLMILDVMMRTDTEGIDLARELKAQPAYEDLPIVLLTCFLERMRDTGAERFQSIMGEPWPVKWTFEKPVEARKLLAKIEGILAARRDSASAQREEGT
jgi:DNA-binding response OmpR family regulator